MDDYNQLPGESCGDGFSIIPVALRKLPADAWLSPSAGPHPACHPPPDTCPQRDSRSERRGCVVSKGGVGGFLGTQNCMQIYVNMDYFSLESSSIDLVRFLNGLITGCLRLGSLHTDLTQDLCANGKGHGTNQEE